MACLDKISSNGFERGGGNWVNYSLSMNFGVDIADAKG